MPRRRIDVVQFWATVVLGLVAVAGAALLGAFASQEVMSHVHQQRLARHSVAATLAEDAPTAVVLGGVPLGLVQWRGTDGMADSGYVIVPLGAGRGTPVTVWTDDRGNLVDPPISESDAVGEAALATTAAAVGALAVGFLVWRVVGARLDRRRYAQWADEWDLIGPRWSTGTTGRSGE